MEHSRIFTRRTPPDVRTYMKELGNDVNAEFQGRTFMESYRLVEKAEEAWHRLKTLNNWSHEKIGQGAFQTKRKCLLDSLFPRVWRSNVMYEMCRAFVLVAKTIFLEAEVSVWAAFESWVKTNVDFKHPASERHYEIFCGMASIVKNKACQLEPTLIVELAELVLPLRSSGLLARSHKHDTINPRP